MASSDVSALVDLAVSPEPTAPVEAPVEVPVEATPESPELETSEPEVEEEGAEPTEPEDKPDARKIIGDSRKALKAFRDSSPENAPLARQLNDIVGRYDAYKGVFPKVADAQAAKAVLDAVGGHDGIASLQETIKSVNETDSLLYAGDPRVLDSLIEDMKAAGKPEAFGKLASPFLDKLRSTDSNAYFDALRPHFFQGLVDTGLPGVLQNFAKALAGDTPNIEAVKGLVAELTNWFDNLRNSVETKAKAGLDPERQAFERERTEFQTTKQKEFQETVGASTDSHNNRALGGALKSYTKLPFFKGFTRDAWVDLGNGLKNRLYSELTQDKSYQSQMDAFFSAKSPDRAKIESFHAAKVDSMAARIVKSVLETRYPGFSKAGAGAKPVPKPAVAGPVDANKPIYVTKKPEWDTIDFDRDPNKLLFISGRAFLKGSGKLVAWGDKWKK